MEEQQCCVEAAFEEISQIVEALESDETTLTESLALYTKGVTLLSQCKEALDTVEKEMITLNEKGEIPDEYND